MILQKPLRRLLNVRMRIEEKEDYQDEKKNNRNFKGNLNYGIRLHIINNNNVAKDFLNSIFELKEIGSNPIDTLFQIVSIKE